VIARMNTSLFDTRVRMVLHRHSFLSIISRNVLKHFFLSQRISIFRVSCEPKTRSLSIKIISYREVILSNSFNLDIARGHFLFLLLLCWLCKHVIIIITHVV
jgi:hypothetical protein